jgi:HPt (histidine-containing phosphotransfer) domain-containing protein
MTQGPQAVRIETLIEHGDTAARRVSADYLAFFRTRLPTVEDLANALFAESSGSADWEAFYAAMHDLRSSSASAGYHTVSAICQSLEGLLAERDPGEPLMREVIRLHLDALSLAISENAPIANSDEANRLIANLGRVANKLARI